MLLGFREPFRVLDERVMKDCWSYKQLCYRKKSLIKKEINYYEFWVL